MVLKRFSSQLSTPAAAGMILDPSSLIYSFMSIPGAQNRSELKWKKNPTKLTFRSPVLLCQNKNRSGNVVFSFNMENSKCAWLSLWYRAFLWMFFGIKYLLLRMTQIHFFSLKKYSTCDRLLASSGAWKINVVSYQELRGELDKVIFHLISTTSFFFFLVYLKYA